MWRASHCIASVEKSAVLSDQACSNRAPLTGQLTPGLHLHEPYAKGNEQSYAQKNKQPV